MLVELVAALNALPPDDAEQFLGKCLADAKTMKRKKAMTDFAGRAFDEYLRSKVAFGTVGYFEFVKESTQSPVCGLVAARMKSFERSWVNHDVPGPETSGKRSLLVQLETCTGDKKNLVAFVLDTNRKCFSFEVLALSPRNLQRNDDLFNPENKSFVFYKEIPGGSLVLALELGKPLNIGDYVACIVQSGDDGSDTEALAVFPFGVYWEDKSQQAKRKLCEETGCRRAQYLARIQYFRDKAAESKRAYDESEPEDAGEGAPDSERPFKHPRPSAFTAVTHGDAEQRPPIHQANASTFVKGAPLSPEQEEMQYRAAIDASRRDVNPAGRGPERPNATGLELLDHGVPPTLSAVAAALAASSALLPASDDPEGAETDVPPRVSASSASALPSVGAGDGDRGTRAGAVIVFGGAPPSNDSPQTAPVLSLEDLGAPASPTSGLPFDLGVPDFAHLLFLDVDGAAPLADAAFSPRH
eukprot:tig00021719_g23169.t1